jgi:two-component system, OmpR family, sensor histidine kinase KdpD
VAAGRIRDLFDLLLANAAIAVLVAAYRSWFPSENPATVSLSFLLVILVVATRGRLWVAVVTAVIATGAFNFFFLPPIGTFTIVEPQNWVALLVFLVVAIVASNLSSVARTRAREAIARRDEVTRLFDLSRDILLTTESASALPALARHAARRFELDTLALFLPRENGWERHEGGVRSSALQEKELDRILAMAGGAIEFDARLRTYGGHQTREGPDGVVERVVPLRIGTRPIGLLSAAGNAVDPGTLDAVAGVTAVAVERAHFLEDRKTAELERQRAELASAVLASFSHDLRTPLTAIQVALSNLVDPEISKEEREGQAVVAQREVHRLRRLFQFILEMAQVDAGISPEREWVLAGDVVDAAVALVAQGLSQHRLEVDADSEHEVEIDPRLTSGALAHVLENAAQHSPEGSLIGVRAFLDDDGLHVSVLDQGPGLDPADLEQLFDPFYRGAGSSRHALGVGLGLSITRGLLAAEGGRVWAENSPPDGARFTILVPARSRAIALAGERS